MQPCSVTPTNKDVLSSTTGDQDRIYFTKWWYASGALVTGKQQPERFMSPRLGCSNKESKKTNIKECADIRNPQRWKINVNGDSTGSKHRFKLCVDWENTSQCLLMRIAKCRTPNRGSHYCTPMVNSCQDSHGNLEHIYTPDTSVRHALRHTWSVKKWPQVSPWSRLYPSPTTASEPRQLLKLEVLFRFAGLEGEHVFSPVKDWTYSHTRRKHTGVHKGTWWNN